MKNDTPGVTRNLAVPPSPLNLKPGEVDPYKRSRNKVAILGTGSKRGVPWFDPDWEIWGLNNMSAVVSRPVYTRASLAPLSHGDTAFDLRPPRAGQETVFRADRWFELHIRSVADDDRAVTMQSQAMTYVVDRDDWPERGISAPSPIYTFPREQALAQGRPTFASTFSWEMALALSMGFEEIGLWGVQLWAGREGIVERPSLNYWIGVAEGRGVKVTIPDDCYLLWHPAYYGLDYWKELEWVGRWVRHVKPTLLTVPERPPCPRPPESFTHEREASEELDPALGHAAARPWWRRFL
jgi:hypothetical protein